MTILRFPAPRVASADAAAGTALAQALVFECRGRRAGLRRDGARLRVAVRRLRALTRSMARSRCRLRRSRGRLRACHAALGAARAEV
jgi:hypothetical protein